MRTAMEQVPSQLLRRARTRNSTTQLLLLGLASLERLFQGCHTLATSHTRVSERAGSNNKKRCYSLSTYTQHVDADPPSHRAASAPLPPWTRQASSQRERQLGWHAQSQGLPPPNQPISRERRSAAQEWAGLGTGRATMHRTHTPHTRTASRKAPHPHKLVLQRSERILELPQLLFLQRQLLLQGTNLRGNHTSTRMRLHRIGVWSHGRCQQRHVALPACPCAVS